MATDRWYQCPACGHQAAKRPSMFGALHRLAKNPMPPCPRCDAAMQLHLKFAFALGVTDKDAVALASYLPDCPPVWQDKGSQGRTVTFYPFLVIVGRQEVERQELSAWLPYFHVVEDKAAKRPVRKYGQWAPFMQLSLFEDVLRQAQSAGYLACAQTPSQAPQQTGGA